MGQINDPSNPSLPPPLNALPNVFTVEAIGFTIQHLYNTFSFRIVKSHRF